MPSSWIERRGDRYRVRFRVGGHEPEKRYAGTFKRMRDAERRRRWVEGELAALRVPDIKALRVAEAVKGGAARVRTRDGRGG